ncbi:type I 3-dehydroquinate dehydratase [Haloplanus aerogenes]|uniref:3-dehydroquinate dehydratase n=1 Tax=Haloplanus aerogenes TaxID=660522 RepID=A0A3M0D3Y6_9EURY|nr:type I 3-dehydroquinate dehydratase [Haloplanus aerogenes]AZH24929.1 type I 3-dehydroquinate dehydratase [Haloplanus aerogenes]RMB13859.1 3-dehydroquinate dehydratase [Haloplanus aerogenes]
MDFDSLVLAAATADLADEPAARDHADAVEFRMDLASDPLAALDDYDGDLPLIATNRDPAEGGEADAPERERLAVLEEASAHDAVGAVDIELASLRDDPGTAAAATARDNGARVIASVHDFEATPAAARLAALLTEAADHGDVGKAAVTATDRDDALRVLSATHAATERGDRVATMAMGEAGRHTRAVAPLYGSKIGYAPVDPAEATAPGQYDLATLADLIDRLGGR